MHEPELMDLLDEMETANALQAESIRGLEAENAALEARAACGRGEQVVSDFNTDGASVYDATTGRKVSDDDVAVRAVELLEATRGKLAAAISERDEAVQRADISEFAYKFGSPFDPTGVKRGVEIIALRKSLAAAEQERDRMRDLSVAVVSHEVMANGSHRWCSPTSGCVICDMAMLLRAATDAECAK